MNDDQIEKPDQTERRSVALLAQHGISTSRNCANVLAAIALDVGTGCLTPQVGNAMCNPIGKLLKLKEMEIKYGTADQPGGQKRLVLTD